MNQPVRTLQGAASQYMTQYRPLLKWITDDLWANPVKPQQQRDKQDMLELVSSLSKLANGTTQILDSNDFKDAAAVFNSAAYDAERDKTVAFLSLPSGKMIQAFIGEARDRLMSDVVNVKFVAPNQSVALEIAKKDVVSKVRTFETLHRKVFSDIEAYCCGNNLRSLSDIYLAPLRKGLEALTSNKPMPFSGNMELALIEGYTMLRAVAAAIDQESKSSPPLNLLSDLERAAKDYESQVAPAVASLNSGFDGIAKHFNASSAAKKP